MYGLYFLCILVMKSAEDYCSNTFNFKDFCENMSRYVFLSFSIHRASWKKVHVNPTIFANLHQNFLWVTPSRAIKVTELFKGCRMGRSDKVSLRVPIYWEFGLGGSSNFGPWRYFVSKLDTSLYSKSMGNSCQLS